MTVGEGHRFDGLSFDRIDGRRGYLPDNVQLTCLWCNRAKNILGDREFISLCGRVAKSRIHPIEAVLPMYISGRK